MEDLILLPEVWDISRLKLWEKNPRKVSNAGIERLKKQIIKHKMYKPLLIIPDGTVIGGNQRLKACTQLGLKKMIVVIVNPKDENEMVEFALSDNDSVGWYEKALFKRFFPNLTIEGSLYGVHYKEPLRFDEYTFINKDVKEDEVPEVDYSRVLSKLGEIYQLGNHRLLCGDSTKKSDISKLMGNEFANLVFTDPPYNVDYESHGGNSYDDGKYKHRKIFNDNLTDENFLQFLSDSLLNASTFSNDETPFYVWYASKNQHIVKEAFEKNNLYISQILIWVKEHFVFSHQDYQRIYEPCIYGWKKDKKHYSNTHLNNVEDVMLLNQETFTELMDVWYEKRDPTNTYEHPTQKPVKLASRAIKQSSKPNDIVLDLFGGSGSTLIACEQLGRRAFLSELDPFYCDVIRKRYYKFIGQESLWENESNKM